MIRISQIRSNRILSEAELKKKAARILHVPPSKLLKLTIQKESIDARRKSQILHVYSVLIEADREEALVEKADSRDVTLFNEERYGLSSSKDARIGAAGDSACYTANSPHRKNRSDSSEGLRSDSANSSQSEILSGSSEESGSSFQNGGFQSGGFQSGGFQSGGFQNCGFQSDGFQNSGFQNSGFQSSGFQNGGSPENEAVPGETGNPGGNTRPRPVIVGFGPAGMFCGLLLARAGLRPIILERGGDVDTRHEKVERFWKEGSLDTECNVQFGEGGAGTFSDGKLNTLISDRHGRNRFVLESFVRFGADSGILTEAKPHIGSDVLKDIVKGFREEILQYGGEIRFNTRFTGFKTDSAGKVGSALLENADELSTDCLILALGHSSRDTFKELYQSGLLMEPKPFAVGLRVQHPQQMINEAQYGKNHDPALPPAPYKLTYKARDGRGVYSFCMCPGGYVVNASSEKGGLTVNGMSYSKRDGKNANSAIVVTVRAEDFYINSALGETFPNTAIDEKEKSWNISSKDKERMNSCFDMEAPSDNDYRRIFSGMLFQRELEKAAYEAVSGRIPCQLYGDFLQNRESTALGQVTVECRGGWGFSNLRKVLSEWLSYDIIEGMRDFAKRIKGFDRADAILSGVEARTSSPVRILRNEAGSANIEGIYPVGEGAGYAGGIMSAAIDGIKCAEKIIKTTKKI